MIRSSRNSGNVSEREKYKKNYLIIGNATALPRKPEPETVKLGPSATYVFPTLVGVGLQIRSSFTPPLHVTRLQTQLFGGVFLSHPKILSWLPRKSGLFVIQ